MHRDKPHGIYVDVHHRRRFHAIRMHIIRAHLAMIRKSVVGCVILTSHKTKRHTPRESPSAYVFVCVYVLVCVVHSKVMTTETTQVHEDR